ncbi:MAG TPA: hypothetical protein VKE74_20835 [Gemmataceae bacterium]|nr:hypothetical protein [Gemmataceae bacterium]
MQQVAERYGVSAHTVLKWIGNAELKAINVARNPRAKRPTWKVLPSALAAFEESRSATVAPVATQRRKRQPDVIQFYAS